MKIFYSCLFSSERSKDKDEKQEITFNNGCLGSRNDEERSETRYVM